MPRRHVWTADDPARRGAEMLLAESHVGELQQIGAGKRRIVDDVSNQASPRIRLARWIAPAFSSALASLSCLALSCPAMPCPALPCLALSCLACPVSSTSRLLTRKELACISLQEPNILPLLCSQLCHPRTDRMASRCPQERCKP